MQWKEWQLLQNTEEEEDNERKKIVIPSAEALCVILRCYAVFTYCI